MSTEEKPCRVCGSTDRYPRTHRIGPCRPCHKKNRPDLAHYYRYREANMMDPQWRLNKLFRMAKSRATVKGREFTITLQDLLDLWEKQGGKCAVSGRAFELAFTDGDGPHPDGLSLDRVDANIGYTAGNVRLVTYHINTALSKFGEDALMQLALDIIKHKGVIA